MTSQPSRRTSAFADPDDQLQQLRRGTVEIISEKALRDKLARSQSAGTPLVIKAGFDPTAPDLHLGHTVLLRALRQFQDLGHKVIFLIGDATALVGDPSGQSKTRIPLSESQVKANSKSYIEQVKRILVTDDSERFELRYNSEWLIDGKKGWLNNVGKKDVFGLLDVLDLTSRHTVARLTERDDFAKRLKSRQELSVVELLYPLLQGYDSVVLNADVELGGTDQKFNLLVGRDLQRSYNLPEPQVVMTLPLLLGTDGAHKMSKSLGNHIGITDAPTEMFGKLMSIPDALMDSYATLLTDLAWEDLKSLHPKAAKVRIAQTIVAQYHGAAEAERQTAEFDRVFRAKALPREITEVVLPPPVAPLTLTRLFDEHRAAFAAHVHIRSRSALRRLVEQGGLRVNGKPVRSLDDLCAPVRHVVVVQAGPRRFLQFRFASAP